jgi:hypothetical protein
MIVAASNVTQEAKSSTNQTGEQMQSGMANVPRGAEKTINQRQQLITLHREYQELLTKLVGFWVMYQKQSLRIPL